MGKISNEKPLDNEQEKINAIDELVEILFHLYQQNPNLADELEREEEVHIKKQNNP